MIGQWISSVPIIIFSIIAGALSDVFGRKPLILLPMIGDLISTVFAIINYAFIETLPVEFFYTDKIGSFFGGYAVYYLGVYSYGTNITKPKDRAHRLARLDGMETTATIIGTILSPIIYKGLGYYGSYCFSGIFILLAIIYIILFVKEPVMKVPNENTPLVVETAKLNDEKLSLLENIILVFEKAFIKIGHFIKISIKIPLAGMKEVLTKDRKTILKFLIFVQFICFSTYWLTLQIWNLIYLYMLLIFNGFTETDYSNFNIAMSVLNTFCLVVIMPILSHRLQLHDALMIFLMLVCEVISSCVTPFATMLWQFYLAQGLGTIGYCKYAVVRSLISKCIDKNEVGKVYSFLAVLASLAPVAGNPLFRQLYNATLDTFPGAIFLLYGAILLCSAIGNLYLYFMRHEMKTNCEAEEDENENQDDELKKGNESTTTESTF
jgi:MFS transporter, PCFT/HCP family, solute carrier family 46, member 3